MRPKALLLLSALPLLLTVRLVALASWRPSAAQVSAEAITVEWDDPNTEEQRVTGFIVEWNPASDPSKVMKADVGLVRQYAITGLQPATVYQVRAFAYSKWMNIEGSLWLSPPSETLTVSTAALPQPPAFVCSALAEAGLSPVVSVVVQDFDLTVKRSDPRGALIRFDAGSSEPITRIEFDLEGDGEPAVPLVFPVGVGFDGRFVRAIAFKPTINGTWPLVVSAIDSAGRRNGTRCLPGITVTF